MKLIWYLNNGCKKATKFVGILIGISLLDELYHPQYKKSDPFTQLTLTNPAIFMVEYALAQVLLSEGIKPQKVLGTSLGEFVAAAIAEVLSFETMLEIVIHQAQITEMKCPPGSMIAILDILALYDNPIINTNSELAAINFSSHFIVSGEHQQMEKVRGFLNEQQITHQALMVNYAFHSVSMDSIATDFVNLMQQQKLKIPQLDFISAAKSHQLDTVTAQHFWDAIRKPIHFENTIRTLENEDHYFYVDVGPSGTLATFVKYNLASSRSEALVTLVPFASGVLDFAKLRSTLHR